MTTQPLINYDEMTDSQRRLIMSLALNDLQTKVTKHEQLLVTGNGEMSLQERMRNIEKFVDSIRYWSRFLIGALIIQTLAFLGGVLVAMIRFLPLLEKLAAK
jgi:hypothetical protein